MEDQEAMAKHWENNWKVVGVPLHVPSNVLSQIGLNTLDRSTIAITDIFSLVETTMMKKICKWGGGGGGGGEYKLENT